MIRMNIYTKTLLAGIALLILGAQVMECDPGRSLGILEVEKIIRDMNQQELDDFIRVINEDEMHDHPADVIEESRNKWKAVTLFIVGSLALFIISQYGSMIFQTLSQIGRDIGEASINTLLEMSRLTPEHAIRLSRALLEDPRSAQKLYRALDYALRLRTNTL